MIINWILTKLGLRFDERWPAVSDEERIEAMKQIYKKNEEKQKKDGV